MITRTTDEMRELNAKMVESDPDEQESRFVKKNLSNVRIKS